MATLARTAGWLAIACLGALAIPRPALLAEVKSPLSPEESLAHLRIDAGLKVELVACEPQVVDPIAIRFDEDGRLWVVEMRDYPNGPPPGSEPLSQIRVLTDNDGDGRYESWQLFADHLLFPTGIQPWKGGLIVTLAGEVVYLRDDDGDGHADRREVWYRGFTAENPQLRANHPRFALDNRVYIANGLRGGAVIDARLEQSKPISISGMDFRFDPLSGAREAVSGNGQFGVAFDDFGNRFVCNNRAPLDHIVLENHYLARNPFLAVPSVVHEVAASGERSHVYPLTSAWTTSNLHAGQFTAACGVEIYRGDAMGDEYRGNAFVCEPTGSLVHREVLAAGGPTFTARSPHEGREFLASDDPWFRPVNLELGPDSALYVVDMYRAVIEHPQFMPGELQQRPDLRWGDDRGRIYRVVRADRKPRAWQRRLSASSSTDLVQLLGHENAWQRETAARLIYERQDSSMVESLEKLATEEKSPTTRLHALWALHGLDALSSDALRAAIADQHPSLRRQAIILAERRLSDDALRSCVVAAASDPDVAVRFQAALALGGLKSEQVVAPLAAIALAQPGDDWTRRAVASAVPERTAAVLARVLQASGTATKGLDAPEIELVRELATVVGSRRDLAAILDVLRIACDEAAAARSACSQSAILAIAQGLQRRGTTLAAYLEQPDFPPPLRDKMKAVFEQAVADASNVRLDETGRLLKIDLAQYAGTPAAQRVLALLVNEDPLQAVRVRAAAALAGQTSGDVGRSLVSGYANQTPAVRRAVTDALMADAAGSQVLCDAVASGEIAAAEVDPARRARLVKHADPAIRARAQQLFAQALPAARQAVLNDYRAALKLESDPVAGKELFRKHCAGCHHVADVGVDVAPDISDSRVKTSEQLLVDILNPNQAIDNNYVSYTVVTHDGMVHTGIIGGETAASVTLRQQDSKTQSILRADIESIRSSGQSLMPEGFEKLLTKQELADVIGFVKNWRYLAAPIPTAPTAKDSP
jgi:putative membrane-bound dehydrogenase-like protein